VWGGASGHTYTLTRHPNETTDIDVVVVREGKTFKGRMLGIVLGIFGKRVLGKALATTVKAIESANPGIDPNHLKIGQIVHLPAAGTAAPTSTLALGASSTPTTRPSASGSRSSASATPTRSLKPGSSYTIKKGDSLQTIAQATYGNKTAWKRIFRANRSELGDANTIPVGTTIRLPE